MLLIKRAYLAGLLLFCGNAMALDGVFVEYGNGHATDMTRIGGIQNWDKRWFDSGDWYVTGFWEVAIGRWNGHSAAGNNQTITDLGITPVFRFQQRAPSGFAPYAEGAIGFHLISPTFINADRKFSTAFQFGDHIGFGVKFGERQQFDLGYRFQHLSNGSIKKPNQGINFNQIRFGYQF